MASTEAPPRAHDRIGRRRPFAAWMRRLANLKTPHVDSHDNNGSTRRSNIVASSKSKKGNIAKNNPYPLSRTEPQHNGRLSFSAPLSSHRSRHSSMSQSKHSVSILYDSQSGGNKSRAPTLATQAETALSEVAPSGAGTSATAPRTEGGRDSTFSSPAPSVRSIATTLTTVQSIAATAPAQNHTTHNALSHTPSHYSGQPATAVPAHLAPHGQPTTYQSATANNVLTDDASILTLASSSKRRRRNSVDTNASMKALAPASMFGGSRESLPLSVLSGTVIHPGADNLSLREGAGAAYPRSALNAERASLISASGVTVPVLASERTSYIGSKYGDAASVRSGLLGVGGGGHGRNDSLSGSIGQGGQGKDKEKEKDRESGMVTAPTSPLIDGPGTGSQYITSTTTNTVLGEVGEKLDEEDR
ncbi:hypothetical protein PV08_05496 [Exophiala spinifera]|uniref:Ca2+-modulated nonselective cation channel polycystin n=1 Tax=Exophiala spinifera TaxID=91928 RepID=A0A0D2BA30_9EURO|nr:uncharacterized protein PV08_05496 [Exophiala spinifera]KIW15450.1 hypothetical protein PV08_05496 [Exophiala spinifera]